MRLEHQRLKTEYAELNTNFEITEEIRAKLEMESQDLNLKNSESTDVIKELKNRLKFANNKIEALTVSEWLLLSSGRILSWMKNQD